MNEMSRGAVVGFAAGLIFTFGLVAGGLFAAAAYVDEHPPRSVPGTVLFLLAAGVAIGAAASPFVVVVMRQARRRRIDQSAEEFESIDQAATHIKDRALAGLVSFNFRLMDRFVNVALGQARAAYVLCAVSASAALLVLLAGTTALVTAETTTAQVAVGILSTAGAALSGFISVTFMRTFQATSRQMSYYYGQPLVHCYLLHAEWLSERSLQRGGSTPFDQDLITETLAAGTNAQSHLLELLEVGGSAQKPQERAGQAAGGARGRV